MRKALLVRIAMSAVLAAALLQPVTAQDDVRHLRKQVKPAYPELARKMNVTGIVRLEIVIAPNGSVRSANVLGGHPLLTASAIDAVKMWQYDSASESTTTTVVFNFNGTSN